MAHQIGKLADGTPLNVAVYRAYRNAGLSHSQALAITAEVGRENGFNPNILFGYHEDPAANSRGGSIRNTGMLSWNGSRGKALSRFLQGQGVMKGASMQPTQANLNAQARFSVQEMKSPNYAKKLKIFWGNPNANPEAYSRELGKHYIVWAYGQNTIKAKGGGRKPFDWKSHDQRRRNHLQNIAQMTGGKYESEPQRPDMVNIDQLRAMQRPSTINVNDLEQRYARPEAIPIDQLRQSPIITNSDPKQQSSQAFEAITAELSKLQEQGLNSYQAIYSLAQRDDEIGQSIRGAFKDGMSTEYMANYFGVNDIWRKQNESSSNTSKVDEQKESQIQSFLLI